MGPHLFSFGSIGPAWFLLGPSGDLAPAYFLFRPPWPHVFLVGSFGGTSGPHMFCFGTLGPTCFLLGCFCGPWACIFCVLAFGAPVSRFHRRCRGTHARTPWATTFFWQPLYNSPVLLNVALCGYFLWAVSFMPFGCLWPAALQQLYFSPQSFLWRSMLTCMLLRKVSLAPHVHIVTPGTPIATPCR